MGRKECIVAVLLVGASPSSPEAHLSAGQVLAPTRSYGRCQVLKLTRDLVASARV